MSNGSEPVGKKKGLSTLAWVGIGCGCLLLIAALVAVAVGLFALKKGKDFASDMKKNPALTAARLIVKADPDLEEVAVDEKAGTITIRQRSTGQKLTVSFEDIKDGRLSFTTDKGAVTLEADQGSGRIQVTGEGDEGTLRFQAGQGEVAQAPDWVPSYPGTTPTGSYSMKQEGSLSGGFQVQTGDPVNVVVEHFRQELKKAGFEVRVNTFSGDDGAQAGTLIAEDEANRRTVQVMVAQEEGGSSATVAYTSGE